MDRLSLLSRKRYISTLYSVYQFNKLVIKQTDFLYKDTVSQVVANYPTPIPQTLRYRINHYRSVIGPFFGELLYTLHQEKPTDDELQRLASIAICTPLFDAFFDEEYGRVKLLKQLLSKPTHFKPATLHEALSKQFYLQLGEVKVSSDLYMYLQELVVVQQNETGEGEHTSEALLQEECWKKGSLGTLIFRDAIKKPLQEEERLLLSQFGYFVQLVDDLFDMRIDLLEDKRTYILTSDSWESVKCKLEKAFDEVVTLVRRSTFSKRGKEGFLVRSYLYYKMAKYYIKQVEKRVPNSPKLIKEVPKEVVDFTPDWRLIFKLY